MEGLGSKGLADELARVQPLLHCFGHIHKPGGRATVHDWRSGGGTGQDAGKGGRHSVGGRGGGGGAGGAVLPLVGSPPARIVLLSAERDGSGSVKAMRAAEGSTILVNGAQAADRPIDRDGFYVMGADRSPAVVDIYI